MDYRVSFGHTSAGVEQVSDYGRPFAAERSGAEPLDLIPPFLARPQRGVKALRPPQARACGALRKSPSSPCYGPNTNLIDDLLPLE